MAWTQGDSITAAKLNAENTNIHGNHYVSSPGGKDNAYASYYFCHNRTGRIMYISTTGTSYWWAEGDGYVFFRNALGAVTTHTLWYEDDTTSRTIAQTINIERFGHGPGWYSGRAWVNRGYGTVNVYWAQDDCKAGEPLVYRDSPTAGGGSFPGTVLTAAILNSGRVGTK